jgi:hypothetical protein
MQFRLLFFCTLLSINVTSQNYVQYHQTFNRIDEDVISEDYSTAINRLDSIYVNYDFIYARHCFKALQISCKADDSARAMLWLEKAFKQGVPIWMVRSNTLTQKVLGYAESERNISNYDSLHFIYQKEINIHLRKTIDSLYEIDQKYTNKVNDAFILFRYTYHGLKWIKNNKNQAKILHEIINNYGFPGERLIGLPANIEDSTQYMKQFNYYGPLLQETNAYIMLIHYYSNPQPDMNKDLLENIETGNLPPYQYGALNDFLASWGKGKYGNFSFYNVWHEDPEGQNNEQINLRRSAIGLNSCEQQNRNSLIWRNSRKNSMANSRVILE